MGYESSPLIYKEIFQLIYYSGGAFTYSDVYNMPVNRRKIFYNILLDQLKFENEQYDKASKNK